MLQDASQADFGFDAVALELCARKIASKSGDLRKGLEVCKKALLQAKSRVAADPQAKKAVSVGHMAAVMRSLFDSPYVETIQALPQQAQYALIAISRCARKRAAKSVANPDLGGEAKGAAASAPRFSADEILTEYQRMSKDWKLPAVSRAEFAGSILDQLAQDSLITVSGRGGKKGASLKDKMVILAPKLDDIDYAMEGSAALRQLLSGKSNRQFGANMYSSAT